ncbi:MAG: 3-hydroxyacyl-CoA dehydrogenase NAD-binding domain-containing protein [Bacteroidota bacterium]|nr:3-hydroxyacyl-CoA dehydrogenase NAD-binding domain-containing protein [Bacteroidota bacterium]
MTQPIQTIAIAGAGTMGSGIAQITAAAGVKTILFDISNDMLKKAELGLNTTLAVLVEKQKISPEKRDSILANIQFTDKMGEVVADLIIEAIVERLDAKHAFFQSVATFNTPQTILASNTSSIPITQIAAKIPYPERMLGIHFFNPAPLMKLVEIISGVQTENAIALSCKTLIEGMGKTCVMVKDAPGFIVNRVARHYYVEALKVLEENIASFEDIDALMESSGFKMGPFRLMDLIGVDTNFSVTSSVFNSFYQDAKFRPSRIQQQKVDAGYYGKKSGKGFYEY